MAQRCFQWTYEGACYRRNGESKDFKFEDQLKAGNNNFGLQCLNNTSSLDTCSIKRSIEKRSKDKKNNNKKSTENKKKQKRSKESMESLRFLKDKASKFIFSPCPLETTSCLQEKISNHSSSTEQMPDHKKRSISIKINCKTKKNEEDDYEKKENASPVNKNVNKETCAEYPEFLGERKRNKAKNQYKLSDKENKQSEECDSREKDHKKVQTLEQNSFTSEELCNCSSKSECSREEIIKEEKCTRPISGCLVKLLSKLSSLNKPNSNGRHDKHEQEQANSKKRYRYSSRKSKGEDRSRKHPNVKDKQDCLDLNKSKKFAKKTSRYESPCPSGEIIDKRKSRSLVKKGYQRERNHSKYTVDEREDKDMKSIQCNISDNEIIGKKTHDKHEEEQASSRRREKYSSGQDRSRRCPNVRDKQDCLDLNKSKKFAKKKSLYESPCPGEIIDKRKCISLANKDYQRERNHSKYTVETRDPREDKVTKSIQCNISDNEIMNKGNFKSLVKKDYQRERNHSKYTVDEREDKDMKSIQCNISDNDEDPGRMISAEPPGAADMKSAANPNEIISCVCRRWTGSQSDHKVLSKVQKKMPLVLEEIDTMETFICECVRVVPKNKPRENSKEKLIKSKRKILKNQKLNDLLVLKTELRNLLYKK